MLSIRRLFATAATASKPSVNWAQMAAGLGAKEAKDELFALRRVVDDLEKELSTVPETVEAVDFAYWRSQIRTAGIVDSYAKAFSGLNVPHFENKLAATAQTKFAQLAEQARAEVAATHKRIEDIRGELAALEKRAAETNSTVEEELAKNPALAAEIADELAHEQWGPSTVAVEEHAAH